MKKILFFTIVPLTILLSVAILPYVPSVKKPAVQALDRMIELQENFKWQEKAIDTEVSR